MMENIFEGGHLVSSIIGWVMFLFGAAWTGILLPYAYDAWIIDRIIIPGEFNSRREKRRNQAIQRLAQYYEFVNRHSNWKNPSNVLNDFGRHVQIMTAICIVISLIGIFFPTIAPSISGLIERAM